MANQNQVDDLQFEVEQGLMNISKERLLQIVMRLGIGGVVATDGRMKMLRAVRDHNQSEQGEELEEQLQYWREFAETYELGIVEVDEENTAEPSEEGATSEESGSKTTVTEVTQQLAAALQAMTVPKTEGHLVYKQALKIVGSVCDTNQSKGNMSYLNLLSQVSDARESGYKDAEIARAVRKAVAPSSHLRAYFDTAESLTLEKTMNMMRSFFKEKACSELFSELGALTQTPTETPTDFLIRALQLRQKVLSTSKVEGEMYAEKLVSDTFCRAVRTGLNNEMIRSHMKGFLTSTEPADDETLMQEINRASLEFDEIAGKAKKGSVKKVTINESRAVSHDDLMPLVQGIAEMQKQLAAMQAAAAETRAPQVGASRATGGSSSTAQVAGGPGTTNRDRQPTRSLQCTKCRQQGERYCNHCFLCGSAEHFARNCRQQPKNGQGL
jgi:hypothetical protein